MPISVDLLFGQRTDSACIQVLPPFPVRFAGIEQYSLHVFWVTKIVMHPCFKSQAMSLGQTLHDIVSQQLFVGTVIFRGVHLHEWYTRSIIVSRFKAFSVVAGWCVVHSRRTTDITMDPLTVPLVDSCRTTACLPACLVQVRFRTRDEHHDGLGLLCRAYGTTVVDLFRFEASSSTLASLSRRRLFLHDGPGGPIRFSGACCYVTTAMLTPVAGYARTDVYDTFSSV